jgi:hypothetical protein
MLVSLVGVVAPAMWLTSPIVSEAVRPLAARCIDATCIHFLYNTHIFSLPSCQNWCDRD